MQSGPHSYSIQKTVTKKLAASKITTQTVYTKQDDTDILEVIGGFTQMVQKKTTCS